MLLLIVAVVVDCVVADGVVVFVFGGVILDGAIIGVDAVINIADAVDHAVLVAVVIAAAVGVVVVVVVAATAASKTQPFTNCKSLLILLKSC